MIKNKKFSITLTLLLFLITLATCLLCVVPKLDNTLHADTVTDIYEFNGSNNLTFTVMRNNNLDSFTGLYYTVPYIVNLQFNLYSVSSKTAFNVNCQGIEIKDEQHYNIVDLVLTSFQNSTIINDDNFKSTNFINNGHSNNYTLSYSKDVNVWGVQFSATITTNFSANIVALELGTREQSLHLPSNTGPVNVKYLYIRYYSIYSNTNPEYIEFEFYCPKDYEYNTRTYYLVNPNNFNDNESFQSGYDTGYQAGLGDGNSEGYQNGYNAGNTIGYNNGYSAGVEASNQYTFLSLMGSVLDAPLQTFTSLLNFNLLGVNMLSFITGLLTLAIIVFIVKLVLGGK